MLEYNYYRRRQQGFCERHSRSKAAGRSLTLRCNRQKGKQYLSFHAVLTRNNNKNLGENNTCSGDKTGTAKNNRN